ncbi:hypothetical protein [Alkalihalophilus marmarensis]|jgi:succinate-acetate transporter protein|uniref:Uncharacterized protein n=1 Tax=Alkalihalophilus marmarensis DSM 21297 TaxID=1188261 RepID=U6SSV7_9BACI|nr:hypothetical protein [Alkalihalophilus marmarensis]ERN54427.1 hypothetical protein A33I_08380 [Alkalihalophilus marmarensis DSM 21297]
MPRLFHINIVIGRTVERKTATKSQSIVLYTVLYFIFTTILNVLTNGINSGFIQLLTTLFTTYLLVGMIYVILFEWKDW